MNRMMGKVALVTGAATGIGRAITEAFAAEGAKVVAMDLRAHEAAPGVHAMTGDVTDEAACAAAVAEAVRRFGALHVLVNNAAAPPSYGDVTELPPENFAQVMAVNVGGAYLMSRAAIPAMAAAGGGSIIHIASQMGRVGASRNPAYCASKGALIQLAKAMAIDHARQNIRVNTLSPGAVGTDRIFSMHNHPDEAEAKRGPLHVLGRMGKPPEIAAAAVFLASDESSFATGSDLLIDGGYTAW